MIDVAAAVLSTVLLLAVLAFVILRPRRWPEAVGAVPAAGLLMALGAVAPAEAWSETQRLAPVVGFLAAILLLSHLCAAEGLFSAAGSVVARLCRDRPRRLLAGVFVLAALTTAVLSLDATAVLLTPVVIATAMRAGAVPRPHVYATAHLANSASLLLPVSNLTNLLAFAASGLTFTRFGILMAPAWLLVIAVEYLVFRRYFAADLSAPPVPVTAGEKVEAPVVALVVLALTLVGFVATSFAGLSPAWAACAGAAVLAVRALRARTTTVGGLIAACNPLFCLFVLALGVVVKALVDNGLDAAAGRVLPDGTGWLDLLVIAAVAALLAAGINNLPATLALLPIVAGGGAAPVLAVLIGVNLGPNLTYVGSLSTLLWRRVLHGHDMDVSLRDFTWLGVLTVPLTLVVATTALWGMLELVGT
ncbi:SLC13 family permease [Streptomyces spiramenti]|uniref:Arsenic transporter n=1 Tax=Streptomyces spiramenti TaxID=2720606 RepID=A0ABX1AQB9_9ACTN|nr:arsenic transporter [Streptomyces spiramenti]